MHRAVHRLRVLNALRHHGGGHGSPRSAPDDGKPGAQRLTASRRRSPSTSPARRSRSSCAQRLTASRRRSLGTSSHTSALVLGAQRLTASRRRSPWRSAAVEYEVYVLNALRHHGGGHLDVIELLSQRDGCSTPYGITAEVTFRSVIAEVGMDVCSTPYGITAEVTVAEKGHHLPVVGAQRLTASRRRSLARHRGRATRRSSAQRLTASRRRSQVRRVDRQGELAVLNALRHHGGGHFPMPGAPSVRRGCSTPYGITAEVTPVEATQGT